MALNRKDIKKPSLPKQAVNVTELGGEVVVQALLLRDILDLSQGEREPFSHIAETLSKAVVDNEGERIFTPDEWEIFGAKHNEAAFNLFRVVQALSGLGEEKKSPAPS